MKGIVLLSIAFVAFGCAAPALQAGKMAVEVTPDAYSNAKDLKGLVLISANWGRRWGFCGVENAQLRSFAFNRMPIEKHEDEPRADLVLEGSSLLAKPAFIDYVFLVEPGEYALTAVQIKVARSVSNVEIFKAGRAQLVKDGKPVAGTFDVKAGEIVYIGHFGLDCVREPTIWRYYKNGAEAFKTYLAGVKKKYPFLDVENAVFRLFQTIMIGEQYQLH